MSPIFIFSCIGGYFLFLLLIAWYTSRNATNDSYFLGNKASPWYAVAFGMIGDSLSGVTFISVPGTVGRDQFSYLQLVLGLMVGYLIIAAVLLPLFYKLNLTSIYSYLETRFGAWSQKTGSAYFILSRTLGAAARLFLAASVIQRFVFDEWGIPFVVTVASIIVLMLAYTYKGGIKTLVWTDTFQSTFLLLGVILSIVAIMRQLNLGMGDLLSTVRDSAYSQTFFWDATKGNYFWKQFLGGIFLAIAMTGLDQNMMQKNLSCRSLREAQWNMASYSVIAVLVNLFFLSMGALLFIFATSKGIAMPERSDQLFPLLALQHLGTFAAIVFVLGLTAATFSSADSVLTTLTTSYCIDILGMDKDTHSTEAQKTALRHRIHLAFAAILLVVILAFEAIAKQSVIGAVLKIATYTYGPLLGLFVFGIVCRRRVLDKSVPIICLVAPMICYFLDTNSKAFFGGYIFGNELLILNAAVTCAGLFLLSRPQEILPELAKPA
ncbi:MAG: sodium:solute symporter [Verrucomicrobia bacterium]|nr:sodium:solute symporter [Verrucomicrobiota bacterium]